MSFSRLDYACHWGKGATGVASVFIAKGGIDCSFPEAYISPVFILFYFPFFLHANS
jgi:hypothetical protein